VIHAQTSDGFEEIEDHFAFAETVGQERYATEFVTAGANGHKAGGAAGGGGEIRDEGATGRGGKPKAGLTGFSVSHLHLPNMPEKWEKNTKAYGKPARMASALEIMTHAPLGSAAFNNEFGRPNLTGYFRSFELDTSAMQDGSQMRGYHKPIMIAGGYGNIKRDLVQKNPIKISF